MTIEWQSEVDELAARRHMSLAMGGAEKVELHRSKGRLTVRERVAGLLDPDSFHELGQLTGTPAYDGDRLVSVMPSNLIVGYGSINQRRVVVTGDDFTIRGGSSEATLPGKATFATRLALEWRTPLIQLVDGSGGGGGVKLHENAGQGTVPPVLIDWQYITEALGVVPVVSMVGGTVAGLGALKACQNHYSVMVRGTSQVFAAGPPLVRYVEKDVDKDALGGSGVHTRNGTISDEAESEEEALHRIRAVLSYLPSSVYNLPPIDESADPADRREEWLGSAVPRNRRQVYDVRRILNAVLDGGSFMEISKMFGRALITGFGRLRGRPVAVFASDPYHYGGNLGAAACQKLRRFVDLAETFHLPRVAFLDLSGLMIGTQAEMAGTVRYAAEAVTAVYQSTVPQCVVIMRRFYGLGAAGMVNGSRLGFIYAWPSAEWGSMPFEGGIEAAYKADLEAADNPEALRAQIEAKLAYARSPMRAAERFFNVVDVIDPRDTRKVLCEFAVGAYESMTPGIRTHTMRP
jgi:acetyl-CoA carboxylase carboxyltransferase component